VRPDPPGRTSTTTAQDGGEGVFCPPGRRGFRADDLPNDQPPLRLPGAAASLHDDQDGYPADLYEHLSTNWRPFYFEPMAKHFAA